MTEVKVVVVLEFLHPQNSFTKDNDTGTYEYL